MRLYQDALSTMSYSQETASIDLVWTQKTAQMTDQDFKAALERYAGYAEEHKAQNLLVNVQQFQHAVGPELGAWRDANIIPRYTAAEIQKMAYILKPEAQLPSTQEEERPYTIRFFHSEVEAKVWFQE